MTARRMGTVCREGHPLEGDNLYRTPKGARRCRICLTATAAKMRAALHVKVPARHVPRRARAIVGATPVQLAECRAELDAWLVRRAG